MTRTNAIALNASLRGVLAAADRQVELLTAAIRAASSDALEQAAAGGDVFRTEAAMYPAREVRS